MKSTQSDLADRLGMTQSEVSRQLNLLLTAILEGAKDGVPEVMVRMEGTWYTISEVSVRATDVTLSVRLKSEVS